MSDIPIGNTGFDRCISWMTNWLMPRLPGSNERYILHEDMKKAHAELAQLRADLQAAQERSAEQARQLDEARNVISAYRGLPTGPKGYTSYPLFDLHNAADEWLAANPALDPQP